MASWEWKISRDILVAALVMSFLALAPINHLMPFYMENVQHLHVSETSLIFISTTIAAPLAAAAQSTGRKLSANDKIQFALIGAGGPAPAQMRSRLSAAYEAQIASIPNHRFVLAEKARHFIMLDDPAFFFAQVDAFLAGGAR